MSLAKKMIKGVSPQAPLLLSPRELLAVPRKFSVEFLESLVKNYFRIEHCFFLSSGKASLYLILKVLNGLAGGKRDKVIIPAYTCPSVPNTIIKAGLKVVLCDIKLEGFSFNEDHLKDLMDDRVLAVIATHLFGIPCRMSSLEKIISSKQIFIVEDFSQSIGASIGGKKVGAIGDVSFSSLGIGKLLTTLQGGMILTSSEKITFLLKRLVNIQKKNQEKNKYWIMNQLIFAYLIMVKNKWGLIMKSPLDPEKAEKSHRIKVTRLTNYQLSLLEKSLKKMDDVNKERAENARFLERGLSDIKGIEVPSVPEGSDPVYMMFPVIFEDQERMKNVYNKLRKRGVGVSRMYKCSLNVLLENRFHNRDDKFPQAEHIAERLLTLPCHPYVSQQSLEKVIANLKEDMK